MCLYICRLLKEEKKKRNLKKCNILTPRRTERLRKNKNHIDDDENDDSWEDEMNEIRRTRRVTRERKKRKFV